jgi:quinol monooxygenase YgiN
MRSGLRWQGACLATGLLAVVLLGSVPAAGQDKENPIVASIKPRLKDPDKPFTLAVHIKVKAGAGDRFEAAFAKARRETRKEKGNLAYELNRDTEDPSRYLLYEHWKNLSALSAHLEAPYIKTLLAEMPDLTTGPPELHVFVPAGQ